MTTPDEHRAAVLAALTTYQHRVQPYPHQAEALTRSWRKRAFALFMDPGLGKTKVVIDTTALMYREGKLKALVVIAPNEVHEQWVVEQLPAHLPLDIKTTVLLYRSNRAKRILSSVAELTKRPDRDRLMVLVFNQEALCNAKVRESLRKFMRAAPSLLVIDESDNFKTPKVQRTRAAIALAPLAFMRRVLTGTPTDGNPFDLFSQYAILDPAITGFDSFVTFKKRYGLWSDGVFRAKDPKDPTKLILRTFPQFEGYKNLQELFDRVAPYTFIKKKRDCVGMPPKVYSVLPTALSPGQRDVQEELLERGMVLLRAAEDPKRADKLVVNIDDLEDDELAELVRRPDCRMTQRIKLTTILRLMQCSAGMVTDDAKQSSLTDRTWDKIPRTVLLVETVRRILANDTSERIIVWAHYRFILRMLEAVLQGVIPTGKRAVMRVDGEVTGQARRDIVAAFKDPKSAMRILVAHPRTLGVGMNFGIAGNAIFYTNEFSSIKRTQAEDRIDRLDSKGTRSIMDIVARDSMTDAKTIAIHRSKESFTRAFDKLSAADFEKEMKSNANPDA